MFREIKYQAYLALVRSQLEYIRCCTWNQHIQKQIKDIDSVQRRAARFVKMNIAPLLELQRNC